MRFQVLFSKAALRQLKKLDPQTAALIIGWVRKNLENCENPRLHGKALTGKRADQWRYRVGDYRLLAEIQDSQLIILMLAVGHRSQVYEGKI